MPLRMKRNPKRKPTTIEYIQVMRKPQGGEDKETILEIFESKFLNLKAS